MDKGKLVQQIWNDRNRLFALVTLKNLDITFARAKVEEDFDEIAQG